MRLAAARTSGRLPPFWEEKSNEPPREKWRLIWNQPPNLQLALGHAPYYRGTSQFVWNATNPYPSSACAGYTPVSSMTYSGQVINNGCNTAQGTWSQPGLSGNFTASKSANAASSESSTAIAWWSIYPTVLLFEGNIASAGSLAGRQVSEFQPYNGTDTCWFPGAAVDGVYQYQLSGGGWYVGYYYFDNRYHYDYIGYSPDKIQYYRNHGRPPCMSSAPQNMDIYVNDTQGSQVYQTNTLSINLPDNLWVGVARNSVARWRIW